MRRTALPAGLLALALTFALAACDTAAPPAELGRASDGAAVRGGQERVAVCHYDADADAFELITVAAPAVAAHLRQGGALPGTNGLDENCQRVEENICPCFDADDLAAEGEVTQCHINTPAFPDLSGIYFNGMASFACSGDRCYTGPYPSCAIGPTNNARVLVTSLSTDQDQACRALINAHCASSTAVASTLRMADGVNEAAASPFGTSAP